MCDCGSGELQLAVGRISGQVDQEWCCQYSQLPLRLHWVHFKHLDELQDTGKKCERSHVDGCCAKISADLYLLRCRPITLGQHDVVGSCNRSSQEVRSY